ncbi:D-alanyl-D-alanine carboxypeptidase, partial [Candidatus Peregrinibacteria bacterium]|nr:D-alanyl-D-alanine carboxypeptidase [Candidatus Peregrinibacteria bacterium]
MITALISLMAAENLLLNEPKTPSLPEPNIIVAAYPERTGKSIKPIIEAKSVLSLDLETGKVLFENGPDQELPMASLTKLMTALVILDNHDLNEIVTIDKRATQVEPAKIYLKAGEQFTIRDLFKGLFIKSANDVALALAYHDSQDLDTFVEKMNKKAQEIGLKNTQFKNPTGLDLEGQYSTANDLAIL